MIVLIIASIVMTFAIPAFERWLTKTEIRTAAEIYRAAVQKARTEAIKRNASVRFSLEKNGSLYEWKIVCKKKKANCDGELIKEKGKKMHSSILSLLLKIKNIR